jgi:PGF-pre-PGF domain-containing protein
MKGKILIFMISVMILAPLVLGDDKTDGRSALNGKTPAQDYLLTQNTPNGTRYFKVPASNATAVLIAAGKIFLRNGQGEITEFAQAPEEEKKPVIVELEEEPLVKYRATLKKQRLTEKDVSSKAAAQEVRVAENQRAVESGLSKINIPVKKRFRHLFNGFAVNATDEEIEKIKKLPYVKKVYPDEKVQALLDDSVQIINATLAWQMNDTTNHSITGRNVRIAIVDTGIDYTHPDLGGCFCSSPLNATCNETCKVIGGYDVVNNDTNPMDDHGHGTHCAGIAAGNGIIKGVAPDAKLLAYKVMNSGGSGTSSQVIEGIERAVNDGADVISMSLGGLGNPDDAQSQAVDNAVNNGTVVVVAAGNEGPSSQKILSPGTARKAITVGASCKPGQVGVNAYCNATLPNGTIASFSSRGPVVWQGETIEKPDVVAPGVLICSSQWNDAFSLNNASWCLDERHVAISGTSMATPHVAGAVALLIQLHPDWTPEQIKSALKNNTVDLGLDVYTQGRGLVDVYNATEVNFSAIVKPPVLYLNETPVNLTYSETRILTIKSLASEGKTYNLSVNFTQTGISASLNQSNITLPAGEEREFSFTVSIDNSQVPSRKYYNGEILAESDAQVIKVPFRILIKDRAAIAGDGVKIGTKLRYYDNNYGWMIWGPECLNCYYGLYFLDAGFLNPNEDFGSVNRTMTIENLMNATDITFNLSAFINNTKINLTFNQSSITVPANSTAALQFNISMNNSEVPNGIYRGNISVSNASLQNITIPFWFIKYNLLNLTISLSTALENEQNQQSCGSTIIHDRNNISTVICVAPHNNETTVLLDKSGLYDIIASYEFYHVIREGINVTGLNSTFINFSEAENLVNVTSVDIYGNNLSASCRTMGASFIYKNKTFDTWALGEIGVETPCLGVGFDHPYFSNFSSDYTYAFLAAYTKDNITYTVGNYTHGLSSNLTFRNNPNNFKNITHEYHIESPKIKRFIDICGYGFSSYWCSYNLYIGYSRSDVLPQRVMEGGIFNEIVYYTPLPDEDGLYWKRYLIEIYDNYTAENLLYLSPYISINDTHIKLKGETETSSYIQGAGNKIFYLSNLSEFRGIHVGLKPIFWFGQFYNVRDYKWLRLMPYNGTLYWLFRTQDYSLFNETSTPYKIYNETGDIFNEGILPGGDFSSYYLPSTTIAVNVPLGQYSFITGRNYTINGINYEAKVNATFNMSKLDSNPPSITGLHLISNNTWVDSIANDTNLTFGLDPIGAWLWNISGFGDGGWLTNVSAFADRGYGWEGLNVSETVNQSMREHYTAKIPPPNGSVNYTIKIEATDDSFNKLIFTFEIPAEAETSLPDITIQSPSNTTYVTTSIWFNVTSSSDISACIVNYGFGNNTMINSTENWHHQNASMPQGAKTATFYCNDTSNNWNSASVGFTIDNVPPSPVIVLPANTSYASNPQLNFSYVETNPSSCWYSLNGSANITLASCSANGTALSTGDGGQNVRLCMNDTANNQGCNQVYYTKDTLGPTITIQSPTNTSYNTTSAWFNLTVVDAISSISLCWANYGYGNKTMANSSGNWNLQNATMSNGYFNVLFYCNDSVSNTNVSQIRYFTVDTVMPVPTIVSPYNTTYAVNPQLNFSYVELNPDSCWYSVNGTTNVTLTNCNTNGTTLTSGEGGNNVRLCMNDSAGNQGCNQVYYTKDTTPPIITINTPSNTTTSSDSFNFTFYDVNVSKYSVDGGANVTNSSLVLNAWVGAFSSLSDGGHNVVVWANDSVGNSNSTVRYWTRDTAPPHYSLNSTNSTVAGSDIKHGLYWQAGLGLGGYVFSFCNGSWSGTNCSAGWANDTWVPMTGTGNWSNVTKSVNMTSGATIAWCVAANDTSNNWNYSSCANPFTYITAPPVNSPYCGDGSCADGESCSSCPQDCGTCHPGGGDGGPIQMAETKIITDVRNATASVKFTASETSRPVGAPEPLAAGAGRIYRYVEIAKTSAGGGDTAKVNISFKVNNTWISANSIDENKVYLNRYFNNSWARLATSRTDRDSNYTHYMSESPGLSVFAITGELISVACGNGKCEAGENYTSCCTDCACPAGQSCNPTTKRCYVPLTTCPACPEPAGWSECANGKQTRSNYRCSPETGYACERYDETKECGVEGTNPWNAWLIAGFIGVLIAGIVAILAASLALASYAFYARYAKSREGGGIAEKASEEFAPPREFIESLEKLKTEIKRLEDGGTDVAACAKEIESAEYAIKNGLKGLAQAHLDRAMRMLEEMRG